jgi:hypothetical protein
VENVPCSGCGTVVPGPSSSSEAVTCATCQNVAKRENPEELEPEKKDSDVTVEEGPRQDVPDEEMPTVDEVILEPCGPSAAGQAMMMMMPPPSSTSVPGQSPQGTRNAKKRRRRASSWVRGKWESGKKKKKVQPPQHAATEAKSPVIAKVILDYFVHLFSLLLLKIKTTNSSFRIHC